MCQEHTPPSSCLLSIETSNLININISTKIHRGGRIVEQSIGGPGIYLNILCTAMRCGLQGLPTNQLTILIAWEVSGLVMVRYIKLPTSHLYNVASGGGTPLSFQSSALSSYGMLEILVSVRQTNDSRPSTYFF